MAKDDRFTYIAGTMAVLITASIFLWSHWGSLELSTDRVLAVESAEVSETPEEFHYIEEAYPEIENLSIVQAVYESVPEPDEGVSPASNRVSSSVNFTIEALEDLANHWATAQVPAADEIRVRKDRDGRMIITAGTHQKYRPLRKAIEGLDPEDIDTALQQAGADDTASNKPLRAALRNALEQLLAVEAPEVEPDMVAGVHAWEFADADFRALTEGQQHMLLMGRANANAVRAKLTEIQQLLGEPDSPDSIDETSLPAKPVSIAEFSESTARLETLVEP